MATPGKTLRILMGKTLWVFQGALCRYSLKTTAAVEVVMGVVKRACTLSEWSADYISRPAVHQNRPYRSSKIFCGSRTEYYWGREVIYFIRKEDSNFSCPSVPRACRGRLGMLMCSREGNSGFRRAECGNEISEYQMNKNKSRRKDRRK